MEEADEVIFERPKVRDQTEENVLKIARKLLITVLLCAAYFGMGLSFTITGPTLVDLEHNTNSANGEISLIFSSRSVGYLLGSIVGGILFNYVSQPGLMSGSMLVSGMATGIAPWCRNLPVLMGMIMFQGISMGVLDTGGNLLCLKTWGRENSPHMQALHFFFGFGAFLGPLLAAPFLHNIPSDSNESDTRDYQTDRLNITDVSKDTSSMQYAYLIVAAFVGLVALCFLILYLFTRHSKDSSSSSEFQKAEHADGPDQPRYRNAMLVLLSVFYFLYVGAEVTYGSLVSKFAIAVFSWSKRKAALVNSVFWGSFAAARLLAVFLALCVDPVVMLVADVLISTISLAGLMVLEHIPVLISNVVSGELLFWILTSTLGIGFASIFPSSLSWIEKYMKVTGIAATIFVIGCGLGQMVMPAFTGHLFSVQGPYWLMYVTFVSSFLSLVICAAAVILSCGMTVRYLKMSDDDENLELLKLVDHDGLTVTEDDFLTGVSPEPTRFEPDVVEDVGTEVTLTRPNVKGRKNENNF